MLQASDSLPVQNSCCRPQTLSLSRTVAAGLRLCPRPEQLLQTPSRTVAAGLRLCPRPEQLLQTPSRTVAAGLRLSPRPEQLLPQTLSLSRTVAADPVQNSCCRPQTLSPSRTVAADPIQNSCCRLSDSRSCAPEQLLAGLRRSRTLVLSLSLSLPLSRSFVLSHSRRSLSLSQSLSLSLSLFLSLARLSLSVALSLSSRTVAAGPVQIAKVNQSICAMFWGCRRRQNLTRRRPTQIWNPSLLLCRTLQCHRRNTTFQKLSPKRFDNRNQVNDSTRWPGNR